MIKWGMILAFLGTAFKSDIVIDNGAKIVTICFKLKHDRNQHVYIKLLTESGGSGKEWIRVYSPIGNLDAIQLVKVAEMSDSSIGSGIIKIGSLTYLSSVMQMSSLNLPDLVAYIKNIAVEADNLESQVSFTDEY